MEKEEVDYTENKLGWLLTRPRTIDNSISALKSRATMSSAFVYLLGKKQWKLHVTGIDCFSFGK